MTTETVLPFRLTAFEKIDTIVYQTAQEACFAVAGEIAALIRTKQAKGEITVLGLATGATPKKVYEALIGFYKAREISFKNVVTFNLDEYYPLQAGSLQSYRHFMEENLFRHIDINPENCFVPDGSIEVELVKQRCLDYEKKIASFGGIDFQLLGIGRNGHIGFNEPGSHLLSNTRLIILDNHTRLDAVKEFGTIAQVPRKAITMGINTILQAKRIVLLAWGENKAAIIRQAIEGPVTEFIPASYLQGHPDATVITDQSAADQLSRNTTPWLTGDVSWNNRLITKAVTHLSLTLNKPVLALTDSDYNLHGLSGLLSLYGQAYDLNIQVFNHFQQTITGWPGGKPMSDDRIRPERSCPDRKRVLIFSPHPDDDIISMGGTFQRLVDQGHEVHVAYQTSGNIAVADDEALRFIDFIKDYHQQFNLKVPEAEEMHMQASNFLKSKTVGAKDSLPLRKIKGIIRRGEAKNTCRFVGIPDTNAHFLELPFYETGMVEKNPIGEKDFEIIGNIIEKIKPHQIYAAADLADPHGTHKVCLDGIFEAVHRLKHKNFMKDCWVWLYKGAWAEWDIDLIEMAVPLSPDQVLKKRHGIFKHQSQKDGVVFQGTDRREFWQRTEERTGQLPKSTIGLVWLNMPRWRLLYDGNIS